MTKKITTNPNSSGALESHIQRHIDRLKDATDAGTLDVTATISVAGHSCDLPLRVHYTGEFGYFPEEGEGFMSLGATTSLEYLGNENNPMPQEWIYLGAGILNREVWHAIDELILADVMTRRGIVD